MFIIQTLVSHNRKTFPQHVVSTFIISKRPLQITLSVHSPYVRPSGVSVNSSEILFLFPFLAVCVQYKSNMCKSCICVYSVHMLNVFVYKVHYVQVIILYKLHNVHKLNLYKHIITYNNIC